ncbi:FIG00456118: hypothetical protein [Caballeronia glathei]|jgi:hypothetical protein|uniref:Uncharacterized protein n=1 Tax=Caballeronia glathei TaxID=60547 RepID=A0A069PMM2_9BURK|nr:MULTISPECIES: hypothetical protein [Burkholderiaceae]KDR41657.1 hypothetical protein BG61_16230 [Caballeronia glathei]TCK42804.1 hypothetical protein B0G84_1111 [Paraburkholderia sp. BL8N3]CDY75908.1 FIG00456118: hypothetical protein [Caballeronia glathei]
MRNKYALFWIWMFLLPLAFDYKGGETGSKVIQILLVLPSVAAGLVLVLLAPRITRRSRLRRFVTAALMLTIAGSAVTQLLQGNDIGNYLRVLLPFLLLLLGYFVGCHPWNQERVEQIEKVMFWSMVVSLVFSFAYGMATGGGLENVRFRIVSVTFLCLQGLLLHEFVVAKRMTKFTVALFLATIVIELLSVTRSLLVGTVLLFVFATWIASPSLRHMLKAGARAAMIGVLLGAMAFASAAFFPSVAEHWAQRIFASTETTSGRDPTTITRLAEMKDQYDQTTSSAVSLLAGKGYGHNYHYSPAYLPYLAGQMTAKDFYAIKEWAAGHNFWVYQFFAGGVLFGIGLPAAVLWALYRGAMAYRAWRRRAPDVLFLPVLGRALMVLAALPATSVGGNPLGNRFSGLVFGIALGLLVASFSRIAHAMRMRTAANAAMHGPVYGAAPQGSWPYEEPREMLPPSYAGAAAPRLRQHEHEDERGEPPGGASTIAPPA